MAGMTMNVFTPQRYQDSFNNNAFVVPRCAGSSGQNICGLHVKDDLKSVFGTGLFLKIAKAGFMGTDR
jgi:hypothetical protein